MADLKELFNAVALPEIVGVDFSNLSHVDIANLLPSYGGEHPIKAILIDKLSGKAYGIASGWDADTVMHDGLQFRSAARGPFWATMSSLLPPPSCAKPGSKTPRFISTDETHAGALPTELDVFTACRSFWRKARC